VPPRALVFCSPGSPDAPSLGTAPSVDATAVVEQTIRQATHTLKELTSDKLAAEHMALMLEQELAALHDAQHSALEQLRERRALDKQLSSALETALEQRRLFQSLKVTMGECASAFLTPALDTALDAGTIDAISAVGDRALSRARAAGTPKPALGTAPRPARRIRRQAATPVASPSLSSFSSSSFSFLFLLPTPFFLFDACTFFANCTCLIVCDWF
jgi:hypothetical protein